MDHNKHVFPFAIRLNNVTCQIGKRTILDHVSLMIKQSAITGILGPNGAGKTTLLSILMGLRRPTSGTITVFDETYPPRRRQFRQRIGVIFQETALHDELTTFENLRFAASLYHLPHPRQRIGEVLELLSLSDRANDRVRALSGGLRRRVALARALLHKPDLLIIDEPTLGVDVEARHAIWSHLRFLKSTGTTIVVSTNYLDEAQALCDMVAVLRTGKLLVCEPPGTLITRAGSCLDVECTPAVSAVLQHTLAQCQGILRSNQTPSGLTIFLNAEAIPDNIMRLILQTTSVNGIRVRAADLAEVFRALEEVTS